MRTFSRTAVAAVAIVVAAPPIAARAEVDEPGALGISFDGYLAPVWDDTVVNVTPGPSRRRSALLGFATLANLGPYAVGGVVDGFPGILGDGRLTVGGVAGWQPQVGSHRYQVLGELGAERFTDVGGTLFGTPSTHETWLDYVGARLGTSETFGRAGHFELGAWVFVRKDLGEANVSNTNGGFLGGESTTAQYRLGGTTAGAALRIGFRFDEHRRSSSDPVEVAADL